MQDRRFNTKGALKVKKCKQGTPLTFVAQPTHSRQNGLLVDEPAGIKLCSFAVAFQCLCEAARGQRSAVHQADEGSHNGIQLRHLPVPSAHHVLHIWPGFTLHFAILPSRPTSNAVATFPYHMPEMSIQKRKPSLIRVRRGL